MADTIFTPSATGGRAANLGQAMGAGAAAGLEQILTDAAQRKAEKIRAGHLKELMPGATDKQIAAMAHLGPNIYENALLGGFGSQANPEQIKQINPNQGPKGIIEGGQPQPIDINNPTPIQFLKSLAPLGLQMPPELEQKIASLAPEAQQRIADQVFNKLTPDQKNKLEEAFLAQAQFPKQEPKQQQMMQQEQIAPKPGIGPQQPLAQPLMTPQQPISLAESLQKATGKVSEIKKQEEKEELKRIEKHNAPFLKQLEKEVPVAQQIKQLTDEMLALEESGQTPENILSRTAGAYAPGVINPYNEYNAKANEIAALKSMKTGRPSVFMTQLQQSTKPNAAMPKEERIRLLKKLNEDAQNILDLDEVQREIVESNDNKQPSNLQKKAEDKLIDNVLNTINPADYKPNTKIEIYNKKFINHPKKGFIPLKGS